MAKDKSSDDARKAARAPRARARGHDSDLPAGKGDKGAPHPKPGSTRFGGSRDAKAPHKRPGG